MKPARPADLAPRRALFALAALIFLGVPGTARALDEELLGALKRVEKVRFEGNQSVDDGAIKKVIKTGGSSFLGLRSPPLYRPDFLKSDAITIRNLYIRHGFLEATATARADSGSSPNRVVVTFTVHESLQVRVRSIEFDSTGVLGRGTMRRETKLRPGEPYDPVQLALDRATLADRFAEEGFFPAITTLVTRDSSRVDIRYEIRLGPRYAVRNITIAGVQDVDTSVVRREIQFKPGDTFKRDRLIKSTERLYGTTLFNSAEVTPVLSDTVNGVVDLDTNVRERKPRYIQGGIGSGNTEAIRVSGEWGNRNLWGKGRQLISKASYGYGYQKPNVPTLWNGHAEITYVEPWLFGLRLRGQVTPLWDHTFTPLGASTFIEEGFQLNAALVVDYPYSESQVSLTMENSWPTLTEVQPDSLDPNTNKVPRVIVTYPRVRRWTLAYAQDVRDEKLDPHRGSLSRYAVQLASTKSGGQGNYLNWETLNGMHFPRRTGGSVGALLRLGFINAIGSGPQGENVLERVDDIDRLHTGGGSTVRGYHENGIDDGGNGGRLLVNLNLEWRIPLRGILSTALFLDGGNVWRHLSDVRLDRMFTPTGVNGSYGTADMHYAVGTGIRVRTPIGPVRLDYGYRLHEDESDVLANRDVPRGRWHFAIGQIF